MRKQNHVHLTPDATRRSAARSWPRESGGLDRTPCPHPAGSRCGGAPPRPRRCRRWPTLCGVSPRTVARVRERFATRRVCRGPARATPTPDRRPKLSAAQEARLIALACTAPPPRAAPAGACGCWPSACVELEAHAARQPRTGAHHAQKNRLKPWRSQTVADPARRPTPPLWPPWRTCWPSMPGPVDPRRPLVCFDEAGKELKAHTRPPQPAAPGRAAREDSQYARARQPQSVPGLRPPPGLAPDQRHRAAHRHRLRPCRARAGRPGSSRRPSASCWCWTTSTPIARPRSTRPSHRPRPGASWSGWSGTTPPRMAPGSTWPNWNCSVLARQCLERRIPDEATLETEVAAWVAAAQCRAPSPSPGT